MNTKFTVLIPVYEGESPLFFNECLESIRNQEVLPDEIIVSIDRKITSEFQDVIEKFRHYLNINTVTYDGQDQLGGSLNLGVRTARNEIIMRMDADDLCFKNRFKYSLQHFVQNDLDLMGAWTKEFINLPGDLNKYRKTPKYIKKHTGFWRNPFNHPTTIFKKSKVILAGNYESLIGFEDWDLWLRMKSLNMRLENIEKPLVHQRIGNGFIDRRSGKKYLDQKIKAIKKWKNKKLIPHYVFYISFFAVNILRIMPKSLIEMLYKYFLRS